MKLFNVDLVKQAGNSDAHELIRTGVLDKRDIQTIVKNDNYTLIQKGLDNKILIFMEKQRGFESGWLEYCVAVFDRIRNAAHQNGFVNGLPKI